MEAMLGRLEPNDSPTRLAEDETPRNGELVDERRQRMLQRRRQLNRRQGAGSEDAAAVMPFVGVSESR